MKLRILFVSVLAVFMVVPASVGSTAFACDPEHNYPCDPIPNDDFQYIYCKLSPTC